MNRSYCTLLVLLTLNVTGLSWADGPGAAGASGTATASSPAPTSAWPLVWKKAAPSPFARVESPTVVVGDKLFLFGGFDDQLGASNELDVYDPANDIWTRRKDMPTRVTHLNPAIDDQTIWFAGGFKGKHPGPVVAEVWKYDIAADTWTPGPPLPQPRMVAGWSSWAASCITLAATSPIAIPTPPTIGAWPSTAENHGSAKPICPSRAGMSPPPCWTGRFTPSEVHTATTSRRSIRSFAIGSIPIQAGGPPSPACPTAAAISNRARSPTRDGS